MQKSMLKLPYKRVLIRKQYIQSNFQLGVHEGDTVELFGPGRGEDYVEPTADHYIIAPKREVWI